MPVRSPWIRIVTYTDKITGPLKAPVGFITYRDLGHMTLPSTVPMLDKALWPPLGIINWNKKHSCMIKRITKVVQQLTYS